MQRELNIGASIGWGTQNSFPFNSRDYTHENYFIKGTLNKELYNIKKVKLEFGFEPTYFFIKHQLLNPLYITPQYSSDYLEKREQFKEPITYSEFSLGVGLIIRYQIDNQFSIYCMGTIGPTYIEKDTERLAKGFAFSDIAGAGISYGTRNTILDFRVSVRHLSNADLLFPNGGHNSINYELGVKFPLGR